MDTFYTNNKDKKCIIDSSLLIGEPNKEGICFVIIGEKVFELKGSGLEILKILKANSGSKLSDVMDKLEQKFESLNQNETYTFLKHCSSNKLISFR